MNWWVTYQVRYAGAWSALVTVLVTDARDADEACARATGSAEPNELRVRQVTMAPETMDV